MKDGVKTPIYKRKKLWLIAVIIVVIFFGIRAATNKNGKPQETSVIEKGTVKEELVLSGELKAVNDVDLAFGSSGILSWVGVKPGDKVVKGQALAKLDTVSLNSAYQQALASLRLAEATVAKVHDNLKGKDTSETFTEKETRITAEVAKDKAYETVVAAQKALRDATLIAPFSGIVTAVTNESPGMNIVAGTAQITVVDPATLYFSVNADQTEVSRFKIGDRATVVLDAALETTFEGEITSISFTPSTVDSGTVYPIRLKLLVKESDRNIQRLGFTGDARFILSQKDDVLYVPNKFIKSDREGKYLFVEDGKTKKYIEIGIEGEDRVEIKTDLARGTVIYN